MRYDIIHDRIIEFARNREKPDISERHHIWPKSLGGTNLKDNMVYLTLREHYIVHHLLSKIYDGVYPEIQLMFISMKCFCNGIYNGRSYQNHKSVVHAKIKAYQDIPGVKEKRINGRIGSKHTEETKEFISSVNLGKIHTQEFKDNASKRFKGIPKSEEHKKKIGNAQIGSKNHMYGTLPWENPSAIKYGSVDFWIHAGTFYDWWASHGSVMTSNQSARMMTATGIKCPSGVAVSCIKKFQSGWVPYNDSNWLEYKARYK